MTLQTGRRRALRGLGVGLAAAGLARTAGAAGTSMEPAGAHNLQALTALLAKAPRRRDFRTVPMILNRPDQWDAEALNAVLAYRGGPRQAWDNTELHGPWLNVMRNSMNAQIWSFRHPDFLCVSATHGSAQLALYDQAMSDKYSFAKLPPVGKSQNNSFLLVPPAARESVDYEAPNGGYSAADNSITVLQRRGVVFLACHNAIWEFADHLVATGVNPDHAAVEVVAAELTNHLAPDVVLTPGAVGTIVELHAAGFAYTR
ncbi:MAG TPA: transcriptional initiation protein Tat [Acetobacteraceae bacterium]|nr:transcriptional initiation protein Tat [Acetobacteraceae bacterium]